MAGMFRDCSGLQTLNLRGFDTSALTTTERMFMNCSNLAELRVSKTFVVPSTYGDMFSGAKSNMKIIGNSLFSFEETDNNLKPVISGTADKVYTLYGEPGISTSLRNVSSTNLTAPEFLDEISFDFSALFNATSSDVAYIGMNTPNQTVVADGINKIISGALMNKTISGIGYYPSNLRLTGNITLSGNNSEFSEKAFIVGDGLTSTAITLINPSSLPNTDTTVEANGTLLLTGSESYVLSNDITVKSGGYFNARKRITITNGAMLKFEA